MNGRDAELIANNPVIGATILATAGVAEAIVDARPVTMGETGPVLLAIESRDQASYVLQGGSSVALHATAAQNYRIQADQTAYIIVRGDADGYIAHERIGAVNATLAITVVGRLTT